MHCITLIISNERLGFWKKPSNKKVGGNYLSTTTCISNLGAEQKAISIYQGSRDEQIINVIMIEQGDNPRLT